MKLEAQFELVEALTDAAQVVQRDGKASNAYIERRLALSPEIAAYIGRTLETIGLVSERDDNGDREVFEIVRRSSESRHDDEGESDFPALDYHDED
jgi:DNA segregation ATPase FtsK/SpoIIIE-like protein